MGKRTRSFTLDLENDELCADMDNASAVVNDLLTQYRKGGDRATAAIELQIEQKERELRAKEREADRIRRDLAELRDLRQRVSEQEAAELDQARKVLADVPNDPENPAVINWADKLEMDPMQLLDAVETNGHA